VINIAQLMTASINYQSM